MIGGHRYVRANLLLEKPKMFCNDTSSSQTLVKMEKLLEGSISSSEYKENFSSMDLMDERVCGWLWRKSELHLHKSDGRWK